ncbi:hydrogenase-4 component F [Candidatus Methylomirabilis lanthanidiphila]|uniref:Hydrogenase-4 component F n=1 Tax=Candidatus Methylomirabilis lanthanidiphila TaxID=2211376 RepID=A0A564ZK77_9BACT|nr:hydrogenase 4 subunit F [Candidatus Methylomirabilis lanthanidiphila]VUZ85740.1 hydrogenase-4 component F [Candidatus Methylomirabilis lanthanidiphila]
MLVALLLMPLIASVFMVLVRPRVWLEIIHALAALSGLAVGLMVAARVWRGDVPVAVGGLLRADGLSALMVVVITLLGAIAALYGLGYIRVEYDDSHLSKVRGFFALFHLFIFTMLLAVTTDNLGIMWVAIEGTTLATAFLVNLHNTPRSLEAAYKYLILSSVGIALAFIGTALLYYSGVSRAGEIAVNWTSLRDAAPSLNPQVVRLAFAFILVGYGTKAGLAPMHTWLPDAHSEAPAPISALMSGVLLNVGLYALMRFKVVVDIAVGPHFAGPWFVGIGLLSLAVAAVFLVVPRNYKRMLAYSSVEHIGVICLGLGFGGYWGVLGALLHVVNHALSKSLLFILSGNILLKYQTTDILRVRGLLRASPLTAGAFAAGTLALLGLPPFGLFMSEFLIFRAGIERGPVWVVIVGAVLLAVVFAGMLGSVNQMLYGAPPEKLEHGDVLKWSLAPLVVNFALLLVLGLTLPDAVADALDQALRVLGVPRA